MNIFEVQMQLIHLYYPMRSCLYAFRKATALRSLIGIKQCDSSISPPAFRASGGDPMGVELWSPQQSQKVGDVISRAVPN